MKKKARIGNETRFFIPGSLPTMNEIIEANRVYRRRGKKKYYKWAEIKKRWESDIHAILLLYKVQPVKQYPVHVHCHWYAKNMKTDPDNYNTKVILDALVSSGILKGDGWKQICGITHLYSIDRGKPGVEVSLWPDGE